MNQAERKKQEDCVCTNQIDNLQSYINALHFFEENDNSYLYIYDFAAGRIYFTDKICNRFPIPPAENGGISLDDWKEIVYEKDRKLIDDYAGRFIAGEITTVDIAYRVLNRNGKIVWINVKGTLRESEHAPSTLVVGRISEMALWQTVDSLTGLCTAEKLAVDLKQYLAHTNGYLMVLGIDNFKNINITQGRSVGDDVLKLVADVLNQNYEYPMGLYRFSGDCFAVIFPNMHRDDILAFYACVKNALAGVCTISAGIVSYTSGESIDSSVLFQYGESALDQAKKEGKNRLLFFSCDSFQRDLKQIELLNEIEASIQHDCKGFFLCYQPQISSQNFEIYGSEALLRYDSPSRGRMSPVDFIPLLESSGLICPIGNWILKTAFTQCKAWRKVIPNFHVSVNLSHLQLQQEDIADTVLALLKEIDLPGEAVTLEVTESIQLQDYATLNNIFYAWKQQGIKISIDDFGTGYSSLSYLKSLEIDEIKIDKCFVDHVQNNAYNYRLLNNIIELAHSAKIEVCCEGVETVEELMALQELHTDLHQGFLFAKPYTVEEFEQTYIRSESKAYQERKAKEAKFRQIESGGTKEFLEYLQKEEISNITESMEEMVYVSDLDTYELYYLNVAGRRTTGIYDYKGRKCYQVLFGRDTPCEFCTNKLLRQDKFYVWEHENAYLNRNFLMKDKLIPWQGKIARLQMAIDITEREIMSQSIQKKLDFKEAVVESCNLIASEADPSKSIYGVVKIIGEFCHGSRAYTIKLDYDNNRCELSSEWCAEGETSVQKYFPIPLEDFPEEDSDQRISAHIVRGNKVIGIVGVDRPRNKEYGHDLVKTMAYFIGYKMIGVETQERLSQLLETPYMDIRRHTNLGLWAIRLNPQTNDGECYPDEVMSRLMGMDEAWSPKECYAYWYSRIKDGYQDYVNQQVQKMISTGKITYLEYPWIYPDRGEVLTLCVGICRKDSDGMIHLEGYHLLING